VTKIFGLVFKDLPSLGFLQFSWDSVVAVMEKDGAAERFVTLRVVFYRPYKSSPSLFHCLNFRAVNGSQEFDSEFSSAVTTVVPNRGTVVDAVLVFPIFVCFSSIVAATGEQAVSVDVDLCRVLFLVSAVMLAYSNSQHLTITSLKHF
jgi:hypothetical protein